MHFHRILPVFLRPRVSTVSTTTFVLQLCFSTASPCFCCLQHTQLLFFLQREVLILLFSAAAVQLVAHNDDQVSSSCYCPLSSIISAHAVTTIGWPVSAQILVLLFSSLVLNCHLSAVPCVHKSELLLLLTPLIPSSCTFHLLLSMSSSSSSSSASPFL